MRYTKLRAKRINRLVINGFTRSEAIILTRIKRGDGSHPVILSHYYIRKMVQDRKRIIRAGLPVPRIDTDKEAWNLYRAFRDDSVRSDKYSPPERKTKHHKKMLADGSIDREHVKIQGAKYRAKSEKAKRKQDASLR